MERKLNGPNFHHVYLFVLPLTKKVMSMKRSMAICYQLEVYDCFDHIKHLEQEFLRRANSIMSHLLFEATIHHFLVGWSDKGCYNLEANLSYHFFATWRRVIGRSKSGLEL